MESWKIITFNVAVYMFLFEIRPLETYLTAYLTGPDGNVSLSEVANTMESIRSYSALTATVIMLAVSEYFYKPAIIAFTACSFIAYILMSGSPSLTHLRVGVAGIGATNNAYILGFSYLYSQISDRQQYQKATSIVSASLQLGIFCGSVLSQIIVSTSGGIYTILPYCNASAMFLAVICACLFPAKKKHSFRLENVLNENTRLLEKGFKNKTEIREKDIILTNMNVLYTYIVNRPGNHDVLLNGYAEATISLCGAVGAYLIGKLQLDWVYYGDAVTAVCSSFMGILMMSCYYHDHLFLIYLSYILYGIVSQMVFVSNFSEIAKRLKNHCYSLVYGFNLFGSLLISAFMTIFFVQMNFFDITIPGRFLFIGGLDVSLGVGFFVLSYLKMTNPR
ncbi:folate transporter 1-like isoform X2 [Myzus persicae]|uniref:folate transporter 1-like isoform X2 n=1 Tax=Myzus persicae TaxID=13164 RepID=UPI000B930C15|nr:folate transporter 1-like isoform X2 [Myzus persicae]